MNKPKYDWKALKREFITGKEPELSAFFKPKNIKRCTYEKHVHGWLNERGKQQEIEDAEAMRQVTKKNAGLIADAIKRHLHIGRVLQDFGKKNIAKFDKDGKVTEWLISTKDAQEIIRASQTGVLIERSALGLETDKGKASGNVTNTINILTPDDERKFKDNISILQRAGYFEKRKQEASKTKV